MQIYPPEAIDKLGFRQVCVRLAAGCMSPSAEEAALSLLPLTNTEDAIVRAATVTELQLLLQQGEGLPLSRLSDATPWLAELRVAGSYLPAQSLVRLLGWLETLRKTHRSLARRTDAFPRLCELASLAHPLPELEKVITDVITPTGEVRDRASEALQEIRKSLIASRTQVRRALQKALTQAREAGYTDAPELVVRGTLLLVPIDAAHKHRFAGVVQDLSATGQTVYMEPLEALQHSNRVRELQLAEQQEIVRILTRVADRLRQYSNDLQTAFEWLTHLDLLQAMALLAHALDARACAWDSSGSSSRLVAARHPLLILAKGLQAVVPLHLELSAAQPVVVISGPNAGGKSIALKTLGLLQLMAQAGLPIPAAAGTTLTWMQHLMVDIGDDQSIQEDLSTYSSHLTHMRVFLQRLSPGSLFLIDEFGTGTDPEFGGPIAEALLEAFVASGAQGLVTTHYSNLKEAATAHPRIGNAALQFDHQTLRPSYRLEMGLPGSSYAFEMAERVGIPAEVLQAAREKVGITRVDAEALLQQVKEEQARLRARTGRTKFREEELEGLLVDAQRQHNEATQERKRLLQEARAEAKALLAHAKDEVKALLKAARALEKQTLATPVAELQQVQSELKVLDKQLSVDAPALQPPDEPATEPAQLQAGDWVRVRATGVEAQVLRVDDGEVLVAAGSFRLTLSSKQLEPLEAPLRQHISPKKSQREVIRQAALELDIRGMRVEEAQPQVQHFLDEAALAGLESVRIIHGVGTGALKRGIRDFIRLQCPQVQKMLDEAQEAGGAGVTVCQLLP